MFICFVYKRPISYKTVQLKESLSTIFDIAKTVIHSFSMNFILPLRHDSRWADCRAGPRRQPASERSHTRQAVPAAAWPWDSNAGPAATARLRRPGLSPGLRDSATASLDSVTRPGQLGVNSTDIGLGLGVRRELRFGRPGPGRKLSTTVTGSHGHESQLAA